MISLVVCVLRGWGIPTRESDFLGSRKHNKEDQYEASSGRILGCVDSFGRRRNVTLETRRRIQQKRILGL
jgi:hypothetical protein